jgi:CubicO group peptidase (beta-lactamase class C family)
MNIKRIIHLFIFVSFLSSSFGVSAETRWPIPDWEIGRNQQIQMSIPQCENFKSFATKSKEFLTEGLVVIKDGVIEYEFYDAKYTAKTPHILWSVSKTITGALLGIAVKEGRINLEQNLDEFYSDRKNRERYQDIKIKNLFYFDTGFIWDEYYTGDVKFSSVLNILYGKGHTDIARYASSKKLISQGPGYKFNYSTGTPAITMAVLKKVYGDDYNQMPWKNLFDPIGMTGVHFEQDHSGVFNGGSAAFATPRDMARLGYLYLNNGMWNGQEILSPDWIKKTKQVSPGYLSSGTVIRDITDDGVYGGSIWLNKTVKPGLGRPYPTSPSDMFLAMGHYGQLIIVLPSQNMVIARTGYDQEYNSKVDEFVSRAIACFNDPAYPIGKNIPPPKYSKISLKNILKTLKTSLQENLIQAAIAKTVCSCHFISKLDLKTCLKRSNIPLGKHLANVAIKVKNDVARSGKYLVSVAPSWIARHSGTRNNKIAVAGFDPIRPKLGCTLN